MFCCLHWIHFMDETEDSIDIKVNYKRKVDSVKNNIEQFFCRQILVT